MGPVAVGLGRDLVLGDLGLWGSWLKSMDLLCGLGQVTYPLWGCACSTVKGDNILAELSSQGGSYKGHCK